MNQSKQSRVLDSEIKFLSTSHTWKIPYIAAKKVVENNEFINHPVLASVKAEFHKFNIALLNTSIFTTELIDLKTFKSHIHQMLEKAYDDMLTTWFPAIMNIFYLENQKKNKTTKIDTLFQLTGYILSDQLRQMIQVAMLDLVNLFKRDSKEYLAFQIKMCLETKSIQFTPSRDDITTTIMSCFDLLLTALDKIPKPETQLFVTNGSVTKNPRAALSQILITQCVPVKFLETYPEFYKTTRAELLSILEENSIAISKFASTFIKHGSYITQKELVVVQALMNNSPTISLYIDV